MRKRSRMRRTKVDFRRRTKNEWRGRRDEIRGQKSSKRKHPGKLRPYSTGAV